MCQVTIEHHSALNMSLNAQMAKHKQIAEKAVVNDMANAAIQIFKIVDNISTI